MPTSAVARDATILFEHTSDAVLMLDGDGTIRHANPTAERLFRRKAAELAGTPFWTLAADGRTSEAAETLERALTRRLGGRFELFHPRLYAWHAVTAVPGEGEGVVLFIRDVTDRMRMLKDDAVRRGIYDVIKNAPVAISVLRGPEHRFEIVNVCARELLDGREIEGTTVQIAFPELVEQGFVTLLDSVYASGTPYHATDVPISFRRGTDVAPTSGVFDVAYQPLRDTVGEITGILSVSVDVTRQARLRQRLEEMTHEWQAILSQLGEGVIVADDEGRIRFVNDAARALHGRAELDVAPDDYAATYALLGEDGGPIATDALPLARAVRERTRVENARWRIRRPDGSEVLVEGTATPVQLDGGASGGAVLTMHAVAQG